MKLIITTERDQPAEVRVEVTAVGFAADRANGVELLDQVRNCRIRLGGVVRVRHGLLPSRAAMMVRQRAILPRENLQGVTDHDAEADGRHRPKSESFQDVHAAALSDGATVARTVLVGKSAVLSATSLRTARPSNGSRRQSGMKFGLRQLSIVERGNPVSRAISAEPPRRLIM